LTIFCLHVAAPQQTFADVATLRVKATCDAARHVAKIHVYPTYLGEGHPTDPPLANIGHRHGLIAPTFLCNLGDKRNVTAIGHDYPNDPERSQLDIFVGPRPKKLTLFDSQMATIEVAPISDNAITVITCDYNLTNTCKTATETDPSFNCNSPSSTIQIDVCNSNTLSTLDVELYDIYLVQLDHNATLAHSRLNGWRQSIQRKCHLSGRNNAFVPIIDLATTDEVDANCVKGAYSNTIALMLRMAGS
jgi:hypothetical protein